ncbi:MAG: PAS domain S-box protein [Gemmatimonadales bacterium]|nr:PAS domain S-box protein [Gemmatimonadales bacterium]
MAKPGQDALLAAIDEIADIVILGDAEGRVIYCNRRATDLLDTPSESGAVWHAFPDHLDGRLELAYHRAHREQATVEITERLSAKEGWFTLRLQPHGEHILLTGVCVTALVVREQLGELESRLMRIGEKPLRPDELLERAAEEFRAMAGWDLGEAWTLHQRREWRRTAVATSGRPGLADFVDDPEFEGFALDAGLPGLAAQMGGAVYLDDLRSADAFKRSKAAAAAGLRSALAIPIVVEERPFGILLFAHSSSLADDIWRPLIEAFQPRLAELVVRARESDAVNHLFELSLDGLVIAGTDEHFRRINDAFCRMLGRSREELLAQPWTHWIHPEDQAATRAQLARLKAGMRTSTGFQNRYRHADGSWRYLAWVVYPDANEGQTYGTVRDVTEERRSADIDTLHRQALEHLARRASLHEILTDLVRSAEVLVPDSKGSILLVRDGKIHLGAAPNLPPGYLHAIEGEPIGPAAGTCGTAAWRDAVVITTSIATDPLWAQYAPIAVAHDLVACWSVPFHGADGQVVGTVAIYPESSDPPTGAQLAVMESIARLASVAVEHRRVDEELRLLQAAVENLNDIVLITDAEPFDEPGPRIRFVNRAFERLTGWSRAEVIGRSPRFMQGPETDRAALARVRAAMESWQPVREELQNVRRDGSPIWLDMDITPVANEAGWFTHWVAVERDVTERRGLEEQLRESQKMEAIGRLAGGIAHDFNNMLTAISGFAELVMGDLDDTSVEARAHVAEIQRAATRSTELTRKLLAFSRRQMLQPRTVDLSAVVREISQLLGRVLGESIHQRIELAEEPVLATVDPGQIEQVLLNLVINAKEAMVDGGSLLIETAIVELSEEYAAAHVGVIPGPHAMIAVRDTGHGMTPEVRERIFEPFFTTKGDRGGTGLGLSTVIGIVSQSGGHIWVESEPDVGTTMRVYFPRATQPVPVVPVPAETPMPSRAGTILVVEDEELLRSLVRRILERAGFTVIAAIDGEEALALAADHTGPLDLLLTDVVLPGINGKLVAEGITALRPGTPVLFMSGYTEDAIVHHGVLDEGIEFLEKPFTRQDLLDRVGQLLRPTP